SPPSTYSLSLHDALPISFPNSIPESFRKSILGDTPAVRPTKLQAIVSPLSVTTALALPFSSDMIFTKFVSNRRSISCSLICSLRSEEHTSELQSRENLVC